MLSETAHYRAKLTNILDYFSFVLLKVIFEVIQQTCNILKLKIFKIQLLQKFLQTKAVVSINAIGPFVLLNFRSPLNFQGFCLIIF